jgi:geranylgeranyl pyrophosphate synthase
MAVLIRNKWQHPSAATADTDSFTLLLTVFNPLSGRTSLRSQVDPATCDFLVHELGPAPPAGFDPVVTRAVADEVAECGPPRPILCESAAVQLMSAPFRAVWNDFEIAQLPKCFGLSFIEPESGRGCRFRLTPVHPRIHLSDVAVTGSESMEYASYTRLKLEGEVDGETVQGRAWFDHQWGGRGWFLGAREQGPVLGWDWLGIQLEDGHDLLVMVHREQRQKRLLSQYAILTGPAGPPRLLRAFELTPTSWWTSKVTHTRYPIEWRLKVPELELILDFTPCARDQEIPMLPPLRALWEGAGRVSGTWAGQASAGHARLELHGYAYLLDLPEHLEGTVQRINQHIEAYFPRNAGHEDIERYAGSAAGQYDSVAQTVVLSRPLWDLFDRGGKRWRPIFAFLTLEALGVSPEPYEPLLSSLVELPHGGSLVIDDIEDNALVRRGVECIHLRYGLDVAINAGNTAYFLPLTLLCDYPHLNDAQRLALYRILSRAYVRSHLGQGQDIYWSKFLDQDRLSEWLNDSLGPKILQQYTQKTASVVEGAAEIVCVIANADVGTQKACVEFGRALGIGFQIVDDIVDFSVARMARGHGGCDLAAGKLSYVIFQALRRLPDPHRGRLAEIFCSSLLRLEPASHAEGVELVRGSGALQASRREAWAMVQSHWQRLSEYLPPSEPKTMLRALWSFLLSLGDDERNVEFAPGN